MSGFAEHFLRVVQASGQPYIGHIYFKFARNMAVRIIAGNYQ